MAAAIFSFAFRYPPRPSSSGCWSTAWTGTAGHYRRVASVCKRTTLSLSPIGWAAWSSTGWPDRAGLSQMEAPLTAFPAPGLRAPAREDRQRQQL